MVPLRYYKISRKLKFRYHGLTSWWNHLWLFIAITALSLFLCFLISSWSLIYSNSWLKNYYHALADGFSGSYENYIQSLSMDSIYESTILTAIVLIAIIIFILLVCFALWLLNNLCSVVAYFEQYLKRYIFHGFFFLLGSTVLLVLGNAIGFQ